MNQKEEKKKNRRNEEYEDVEQSRSEDNDKRRYEEEGYFQGKRNEEKERNGKEKGGSRWRRRSEEKKRERDREEEQGNQEEGRYERDISSDHIPLRPIAAPCLKWKVFVRGSESILEGRGVREEKEDCRERHKFTSSLDGEATRSFYEGITGQTDTQVESETNTQIDRKTDKGCNRQKDKDTDRSGAIERDRVNRDGESCMERDRHELRTDIDRNRETDGARDKPEETDRYRHGNTDNRQREGYRHTNTDRPRKASSDTPTGIHKQTEKSASDTHLAEDTHSRTQPSTFTPTLQDNHTALRFAENNDVNGLNTMLNQGMSVNTKDRYGWSLLMVAACAGAADVVRMLLTRGARTGLRDAKGNTALYLATIKNHRSVTEMLIKANKKRIPEREIERDRNGESRSSGTMEDEEYFCDTCGITVKEQERTKHKASIIHQFKTDSGTVRTHYGIPPTNRGYQLLVGQGWDTQGGLGSEKQGQKFPVKTVLKRDREGLGAGGEGKGKARVTHFGPGDEAAVKKGREGGVRMERVGTVSKKEMRRRKEREQKEEVRLRRMLNEPDY